MVQFERSFIKNTLRIGIYRGWIDVKKELPTKGQKVLCVQDPTKTASKESLFAIFNGKYFTPPEATIYFANSEKGTSKWVDIIYWMPLPSTPNENI